MLRLGLVGGSKNERASPGLSQSYPKKHEINAITNHIDYNQRRDFARETIRTSYVYSSLSSRLFVKHKDPHFMTCYSRIYHDVLRVVAMNGMRRV